MKYNVEIHPGAMEDIRRNARWWAEHHSETQALAWYDNALDSLYKLEQMPASHGLSHENDDFPYEIRDCLFGLGPRPTSYRGVFTIVGDTVHVLTVQRSSQDTLHPDDVTFNPGE